MINLSNYSSIQAAFDEAGRTGDTLYVPPGRHIITSKIFTNNNIHILGDSSAVSIIVVKDGGGIVYHGKAAHGDIPDTELSGQYHTNELFIENVSFCVEGITDKVIDATWSNSGNSGSLAPTFTMRNAGIYAAPAMGTEPGRWSHAIYLTGASNVSIDRCRILGGRDGKYNCTFGLYVNASSYSSVELFISKLHTSYCMVGAYFDGHVEGINIDSCTLLECLYNIIADTSSNPGAWPMINVNRCHMSYTNASIVISGMVQFDISHNLIYHLRGNDSTSVVVNSKDIVPCELNSRISNNTFINIDGANSYGIIVNHTQHGNESLSIVGANIFDNFTTAINLNNVSGVLVDINTKYNRCINKVL